MGLMKKSPKWSLSMHFDDFLLLYGAGVYFNPWDKAVYFCSSISFFFCQFKALSLLKPGMCQRTECLWKAVSWTLSRKPLVAMTLQLAKWWSTRGHSRQEKKMDSEHMKNQVFKQNWLVIFFFSCWRASTTLSTGWNKYATASPHPNPQK